MARSRFYNKENIHVILEMLTCCCHIVTLKYLPQEVKLQHQKTDNIYFT